MSHTTIDQLVDQLKRGQLNRRGFVRQATALGLSVGAAGAMARNVVAQDASPAAWHRWRSRSRRSPVKRSRPRSQEEFDFSEPESTGGDIIHVETTDIQTLNTTLSSDVYSGWITGFIFDALVGGKPDRRHRHARSRGLLGDCRG